MEEFDGIADGLRADPVDGVGEGALLFDCEVLVKEWTLFDVPGRGG